MAGPCLNDTESISLNRDTSGNIEADLIRNGDNASGIELTASGVRVFTDATGGVVRTATGLALASTVSRTGYEVGGATGDTLPGTTVGPGAYVQIGGTQTLAIQRQAAVSGQVEIDYGAVIGMEADDIFTVNPFQGWVVALERRIWVTSSGASGAWIEADSQGSTGASAHRHSLRALEDIALNDDVNRTLEVRVTVRGGIVENVVCRFLGRRFIRARYI